MPTRAERMAEFFARLERAPACESSGEAYDLVAQTMTDVEDQLTDTPNVPSNWRIDRRLYPPQADHRTTVSEDPLIELYRSRGHVTLISASGAIEITLGEDVCLDKPGSNGLTISMLLEGVQPHSSSQP